MRIAVLADIHGNREALAVVLAEIDRLAPDAIVNLGDLVAGPLDARGTLDLLADRAITTIRGNHDRVMGARDLSDMYASDRIASAQLHDSELDQLLLLPETLVLNGEVFLCHGTPDSDMDYWLEEVVAGRTTLAEETNIDRLAQDIDCAVLLCGHSHVPRSLRLRDGRMIVNPGSVGCPAYDWDRPTPHRVENGSPDAAFALIERRGSTWSSQQFRLPYDAARMIALAESQGQTTWAHALASGRVT